MKFLLISLGYQTAFSELMFAGKKEHDPFYNFSDPKEYLAKQIYKLSLSCPGKVCKWIVNLFIIDRRELTHI